MLTFNYRSAVQKIEVREGEMLVGWFHHYPNHSEKDIFIQVQSMGLEEMKRVVKEMGSMK